MHREAKQFVRSVRKKHPYFFRRAKVLEVGSLNINGTIRTQFTRCDYLGIDLGPGRDVDMVSAVRDLPNMHSFDVVISMEAMEHDEHWDESLNKMYRKLKPDGLLIITCAGPSRAEHGTKRSDPYCSPHTTDYYRNISIEDFHSILPANLFTEYFIGYQRGEKDLIFYGIKK